MHHRAKDITGLRVGYLTATAYAGSDGKNSLWTLRCDCGRDTTMPASEAKKQLKKGIRASCGCMRKKTISEKNTKHGMSQHKAFAVWRNMLDRCALPTHQSWANYGGRGITVCEAWRASFLAFWTDMGPTYAEGLTLDRRDNDGGYSPENCWWISPKAQSNNTRRNVWIDTPWGLLTVAQASEKSGINVTTLLYRLKVGVSGRALFSPPDTGRKFMT